MIKIHLEVQPTMAESLGMEAKTEVVISEQESNGNRSVKDLLNQISAKYQHFGNLVFDTNAQKLTGKALLFVNGRSLEPAKGLETKLKDGDMVTFVPLIEGG